MSTRDLPADWFKSAVVYQIYPRSFADSNGDGYGDVPGIISKLDYLKTLGVDVIWLSPIYKSPQDDNGYDISDYEDIDPMFGSLEQVRELFGEVHSRGMKIVMDLVVNHSSDEHAWFIESASSKDNPKADWYIWSDTADDLYAYFGGGAWEWVEARGQYYFHQFSKKQPDLNWENPDVRAAVYKMMNWWIDQGVDGFRMDVINLISKDWSKRDQGTWQMCQNGPRVHEWLQEMNREVLRGKNLITVGEMPGASVEWARDYTNPERHELNMVFTFEHMDLDGTVGRSKFDYTKMHLPDLKANLGKWQKGLESVGWNSLYWNNHDQPRIVSRWGNDGMHRVASAKALGTVLHLMRGTPYIYQGEELGMTNCYFTELDQYQDIESVNWAADAIAEGSRSMERILDSLQVKSRDNARTPMLWNDSENAGFTTGKPWLKVNDNYTEINAEAALADKDSVFWHYRDLIALRHNLDIVVNGSFDMIWPEHEQIFAYQRKLHGKTLTVVANFSDHEAQLPNALEQGEVLIGQAIVEGALAPWQSFAILS
ncbi:MAG: alpha-glucosidase [Micrococcales bacterium]